jgi:O6-methylguanine-DNA--protein-cysteine methyltransferase
MNNYIKVKDRSDLVRDSGNKAILNIDTSALNKYKEDRQKSLENKKVLEDYKNMKEELREIKDYMNGLNDSLNKMQNMFMELLNQNQYKKDNK